MHSHLLISEERDENLGDVACASLVRGSDSRPRSRRRRRARARGRSGGRVFAGKWARAGGALGRLPGGGAAAASNLQPKTTPPPQPRAPQEKASFAPASARPSARPPTKVCLFNFKASQVRETRLERCFRQASPSNLHIQVSPPPPTKGGNVTYDL